MAARQPAARGAAEAKGGGRFRISVRSLRRGLRLNSARVRRVAERILDEEGFAPGRVSVVLLGDRAMAKVNREFTGRGETTDVLSFDLRGGRPEQARADGLLLGEVLISVDRAREQAREARTPLAQEIALLVVHGLLHLAGYQDDRPAGKRRMRNRERYWLRAGRFGRGWLR